MLRPEKDRFRLLRFDRISLLSSSSPVAHFWPKQGENLSALVSAWHLRRQPAVLSVHGPDLYLKTFSFPRLSSRKLRAAAILQATADLPYSREQLSYDVMIWRSTAEPDRCEVFFMAAKKQQVLSLAELVTDAGLRPVAAEFSLLALRRAVRELPTGSALGYVRSEFCGIGVFRGMGLRHQFFWNDSGASWRRASEKTELPTEAGRVLRYLEADGSQAIHRLYLAAENDVLQHWQEAMQAWDIEVLPVSLAAERLIDGEALTMAPAYYIALGLALRGGK